MQIPAGYQFAGVGCGIKQSGKLDYCLIVSDRPCVAAGVYTQNIVFAAPVAYDRALTPGDRIRAVAVNSGNANACTGDRGLADAEQMAADAARHLHLEPDQVLIMSTGIIGEFLPMDCLAEGAAGASGELAGDESAFHRAAQAILTTDNGEKSSSRRIQIDGQDVCLAGMAKGAGMIGPNMATMLATIITDARLATDVAQEMLKRAVDRSFNNICVEGHTSTNDTVLLLANGAAGGQPLADEGLLAFESSLTELCIELARMIPNDGEGASHLITIRVSGAANTEDARQISKTIAESALVKTGVAGHDPNWGRIVSAAGYSGIKFDPQRLQLHLNGFLLYENGMPVPFQEQEVSQSMAGNRETVIALDLQAGDGAAVYWTSDLTVDYVRFNSDYHT